MEPFNVFLLSFEFQIKKENMINERLIKIIFIDENLLHIKEEYYF